MKEILYNYDFLTKDDITETVVRIKVLLINSNNEIILANSHNKYQFPGGHVEPDETFIECLKREVKEETGIELETENPKPFFVVRYYNKNYYDTGENRSSEVYYYVVRTDQEPNIDDISLTDNEKEGNMRIEKIAINSVEKVLLENIEKYPEGKIIAIDMIEALKEYKELGV